MIVINDRLKLAEALRERGLIQSGDDHYREILDEKKSTDAQIIEKAAYYKVELLGAKNDSVLS